MAEFMEQRDVSRREEKLALPRSLQENGEEAEMIWDIIAKRYPKAAPLLCEMEAAIGRAEKLLHRLRTAPYNKGKGIESASSDESEKMLSADSGTSMSTSEEIDIAEAGTRTSDDCVANIETQTSSSSQFLDNNRDIDKLESVDSRSHFIPPNTVGDSTNTNDSSTSQTIENISQKNDDRNSINFPISENRDSAVSVKAKQVSSLEEWDKVVGGKVANSKRLNVKKALAIIPPDCSGRPDDISSKNVSPHRIARVALPNVRDPGRIFEETISPTPKVIGTTQNEESARTNVPKRETTSEPKRRAKSTPDPSPIRNANETSIPICKEVEKMRNERGIMAIGDDNNPKSPTRKTAVIILNDYAKRCNEQVNYSVIKNKINSWEIECTFAKGYKAESIGNSESEAQEAVATNVLKLLVENEMDEGPKNLPPLSTEQMRDIFALGGERPENAMRKLYKLCLEKNAPKPVYSVEQDYGMQGVRHSAVCKALNEVGKGCGIRENIAKISAADDLYRKLCSQNY